MSPGTPCYFLVNGHCSDYDGRPEDPCRVYSCAWLDDTVFPNWLKPNLANIIISKKTPADTDIVYYEVVETGVPIDSAVLNWIIRWAIATSTNLMYSVKKEPFTIGSLEFTQYAKTI